MEKPHIRKIRINGKERWACLIRYETWMPSYGQGATPQEAYENWLESRK